MKKSRFIFAASTFTLAVIGLFAKAEKKCNGVVVGYLVFSDGTALTVQGLSSSHFTTGAGLQSTVLLKTRGANTTLAIMYTAIKPPHAIVYYK